MAKAFDFKKELKDLYMPKSGPSFVNDSPANFIAVRGHGDPNVEGGEYQQAIEQLYTIAYTIKMSKMGERRIGGYFDFVVPPLEGFWWQDGICGVDYSRKDKFRWISAIRMPDFVTEDDLAWAKEEAFVKKGKACDNVDLMTIDEGECVQMMHIGPYDDEPATVAIMDAFVAENGYVNDFSDARTHHEIYLSDPRRTAPEKLKTVIRHPVKKEETR